MSTSGFSIKQSIIIGIDEVGRGPLAGPVTIGICVAHHGIQSIQKFRHALRAETSLEIKDSKKLQASTRQHIFDFTKRYMKDGHDVMVYSFSAPASRIDKEGISVVISSLISKALKKISTLLHIEPANVIVFLDGGLRVPKEFINQQTIIRGDEKVHVIGLASIYAKVTRDAYMKKSSCIYPHYEFDRHKGYGTKVHIEKIQKYGLTKEHRITYCKNIKSMS